MATRLESVVVAATDPRALGRRWAEAAAGGSVARAAATRRPWRGRGPGATRPKGERQGQAAAAVAGVALLALAVLVAGQQLDL